MKRVRFSKDNGKGVRVTSSCDSPHGPIFVEHDLIANRVRVVSELNSLTVRDPLTGIDLEERISNVYLSAADIAKFLLLKAGAEIDKETRNRNA